MNNLIDGVWYHIPGFNGYVINNEGSVKSYKFFNTNPEGIILKYYKNKKGGYYILTDDKNRRKKKSKEELLDIVIKSPTLYPIAENAVYMGSRNRGWSKYTTKHPDDKGTVKIDIMNSASEFIERDKPKEITLRFPFEFKKDSENMVKFY